MTIKIAHEIIFASTECSIDSGYSGFGIRTHSKNLPQEEANDILEQCPHIYPLKYRHPISLNEATEQPDIVYDFPPVFFFKKVIVNNKEIYVAGRTVYIGINYGFYSPGGDNRTGSNAICHIVAFEGNPLLSVIGSLICGNFFIPSNWSCRPDNLELKGILSGKPSFIEPHVIDIDISATTTDLCDGSLLADSTIALLQSKIYSVRKKTHLTQILFVATSDETKSILQILSQLPSRLVADFTFQTSYSEEGYIPQDLKAVFVDNDQALNGLYKSSLIVIDRIHHEKENIEERKLYETIKMLIDGGHSSLAMGLIDFFLDQNIDEYLKKYEDDSFLCQLFLLLNSKPEDVAQEPLSLDFFEQLRDTPIVGIDNVWERINEYFQELLTTTMDWEPLMDSLELVESVEKMFPQFLHFNTETISQLDTLVSGKPFVTQVFHESSFVSGLKRLMLFSETVSGQQGNGISNRSIWKRTDASIWTDFLDRYLNPILDISDGKVPQNVDLIVLKIASELIGSKPQLFLKLFSEWIAVQPPIEYLKKLSMENKDYLWPIMDSLVLQLWELSRNWTDCDRLAYLRQLTINGMWNKHELDRFIQTCKDMELAECLQTIRKSANTLFENLFSIFKKS